MGDWPFVILNSYIINSSNKSLIKKTKITKSLLGFLQFHDVSMVTMYTVNNDGRLHRVISFSTI